MEAAGHVTAVGRRSTSYPRLLSRRTRCLVVRWRACDLIMRLHEEFGISVSDDTVYRALKELGYSHVSARPKAYKQNPEAIEAFKKSFPPAWRRSAPSLRLAHR